MAALDRLNTAADGRGMTQDLLAELPPAQRLALAYAPKAARSATLALLALDARLGAVLRRQGEPVLAQMRFAWWRDTLRKGKTEWLGGDAVLALLGEWRDPAALVPLVDGWEGLLAERLDAGIVSGFAGGRGLAFAQLAAELGAEPAGVEACAGWWALGDLAANVGDPAERATVIGMAAALPPCRTLPRKLRPLAVLAGLGRRSLARGGTALLDRPRTVLLAARLGIVGR